MAEKAPGLAVLPAAGFALLLAFSGFWMLAMPHYHAVGDNLLTNGSFDSADAWRVSEGVIVEGGAAVLGALGPGNLTLTQRIAGTPGA